MITTGSLKVRVAVVAVSPKTWWVFYSLLLIKFAFTPGEVLPEAASRGHQLLPPEQGVAQVRRVYLDNIK